MKDNKVFNGVMTALVTPLDKNGKLNVSCAADLVEYQLAAGIDGFYLCGGTGEGVVLTPEIRMQMVENVVRVNRGRGKIIVQTGAIRAAEAFLLTEHAQKCRVDGISSIPPSLYYQYPESDTIEYYRELAGRTDLPVLIYRTPAYSTGGMVTLMEKLIKTENIVGLKYTGASYYEMWKLLQLNDGNINVINGADETLLCGLVTGAQGGIGALYNIIPEEFVALYKAFAAGDIVKAKAHQHRIASTVATLGKFIRGAGIILPLKAILQDMGFAVGSPVSPAQDYPAEVREELISAFRQLRSQW